MFWVCLYFFLFPDLSGEDKTQSGDSEDGQSWPKGAGICRHGCGVEHFHFNDIWLCSSFWSLIYAACCWVANILHYPHWGFCELPHLCQGLHSLSKVCLHWFVLFLFSTYSWFADVSGAVWCWDADKSKHYTTHRWTLVNRGRCYEIHYCTLQDYT